MAQTLIAPPIVGRRLDSRQGRSHLSSVASYLSNSLLQRRLRSDPGADVIGDFLDGTLLFADVSGFTALSEQLAKSGHEGAEKLTSLLNDYFEAMIGIVAEHHGDVLQFGGDSLLVVFGATDLPADHCRRSADGAVSAAASVLDAARCGLQMQSAMKRFERLDSPNGVFPLTMRIAVHTGTFLLGGAGSDSMHRHQVILGPTVNRLADAQRFASPGEVLITADASQIAGDRIELSEPIEGCFRVAAVNESVTTDEPMNGSDCDLAQLDEVAADAAEKMLCRYLIPAVYRRIVENPGCGNEGEHRHITTMFVHFVGMDDVMRTSGRDQALNVVSILDDYLAGMNQIIQRHGGVLARVSAESHGDKLLVLFGAPLAVEHSEQSALRCALEMNQRLEELNRQLPVRIEQRIGITAGNAFCGNVGSNLRREYTVMGQHVNAAARLMMSAGASEILVSPDVWKQARRSFRFKRRGAMTLKGMEHPMQVLQLICARTVQPRTAGSRRKLIGREGELSRFRTIVSRALAGEGQVVEVSGEPGVGKSRLIEELVTRCRARGMTGFLGQCDAYGSRTAYLPWMQIIRDLAGITSEDSGETSREKLELALVKARHDLLLMAPLLGNIAGLTFPENEYTSPLTPRQRKEKIFDICLELLRARARSGPAFLVIEDMQWIDALSKELLIHVSTGIQEHGILVVAVHRAECKLDELGAAENRHHIHLAPFSIKATIELLQTQLGTPSLPDELVRIVHDKTRGNPLFVEEMVRALLDTKHLVRDPVTRNYAFRGETAAAGITGTVQSLILSRVDRLDEEPRQILQVASVFGKTFTRDPLHSVLHFHLKPDRLESRLREISRLELIAETPQPANSSFAFRHALVQEAIYESISFARRRELHGTIGEALEQSYGDDAHTQCEELARHFDLGHSDEKALKYLLLAGDKARAASANAEAADYYERALAHLQALKRGDPDLQTRLLEDLGDVHSLSGNYTAAIHRYEWCLEQVEDPVKRAHIEGKLGGVAYRQGQPQRGIEHLERGLLYLGISMPRSRWQVRGSLLRQALLQIAHTILPKLFVRQRSTNGAATSAAIEIYEALSRIYYESDLERTLDAHLRQLNLCETIPDSTEMAQTYSSHGIVCGTIPLFRRAIRYQERGLAIRKAKRDRWGVAQSSNFMGISYYWMGCYEQASACLEHSAQTFREVGDRWETQVTYLILSYVHMRRGELEKAQQHALTCLELDRRADDAQGMGWALGALAEVYCRQGKLDEALTSVERAAVCSGKAHDRMYLAVIRRVAGEIHLRMGNPALAIHEMRGSLQQIEDYGLRHEYVLGAYSGLAEAHLAVRKLAAGNATEATAVPIGQIRKLCRQGVRKAKSYRNWLGYAYRVSALCEEAAGRPAGAKRFFHRSIEASGAIGAQYDLGMAHCELGRLLLSLGDPAGHRNLQEAQEIFTKCGAAIDLRRADAIEKFSDRSIKIVTRPRKLVHRHQE